MKQYFRWELVLALSLVGCTSVVPNRLGLPQLTKDSSGASSVITQKSNLYFQVRWPERQAYQTQDMPQDAESLEVSIKAKDGTPIDSKMVARPADATTVSDIKFQLDPALKKVDIFVRALNTSGNEVAFGKVLDVPIRDNTATGVTVTLVKGSAQNAQLELEARITNQLTLLHNIQNYFSRFDNLRDYGNSDEAKAVNAAVQAIGQNFPFKPQSQPNDTYTPDPNYTPPPGSTTGTLPGGTAGTAYRAFSLRAYAPTALQPPSGTIRLVNPNDPTQYMDILNGVMTRLYWPGYVLTPTYQDMGGGLHVADFPITPVGTGGDGSSADLTFQVQADTWVPEPALTAQLDGLVNGQSATESITFFGGLRPDPQTLRLVKVGASVTPVGDDAKAFKVNGALDGFRDLSASPFYHLIQENMGPKVYPYPGGPTTGYPAGSTANYPGSTTTYPSTYPSPSPVMLPANWPTHAVVQARTPSAQATADIKVNDDLLGVQTRTELHLKDKLGNFSDFLLQLGVSTKIGTVGGRSAVTSGDFGFALTDQKEALKLEGVVHGDATTGIATVTARFVDVPSNTVIGNLDWTFDPKADPNHITYWPLLKLQDQSTYRLTPGFFSGETTGNVRVDVR